MSQTTLTIRQWATYRRVMTLKDAASNPIDLTGFSVQGMIRHAYLDTTPVVTFFVTPNPDPTTGEVSIELDETETGKLNKTSWTKATYKFDFVLIDDATDVRQRIVEGDVIVYPGVTHDAVS